MGYQQILSKMEKNRVIVLQIYYVEKRQEISEVGVNSGERDFAKASELFDLLNSVCVLPS